jgi:uncharacterized protein
VPGVTEEQLTDDLTRAMKARDMPRVYVLRGLLTAAKNLRVEKRGAALGEEELVQLVRREIRKREEAEGFATKAGRQDLIQQNQAERELLEVYVPAQLAAEQLEEVIRKLAAQPGARSLGVVMGALREQFAGRYDGRQASEIARRVLSEAAPA